ncbi:hypothetical protein [Megamonas funiformis]|uniref:hypothetical protein n=1 Tax=Megamonas funiformis TaxID=437897 RepID=UPI00388F6E9F
MKDKNISEINNKWICPNCGQVNNDAFCSKCGHKKPLEAVNPMNELQNLVENNMINDNSGRKIDTEISNKINPLEELQDLVKEPILKTNISKRNSSTINESGSILKYIIIGVILVLGVFLGIYFFSNKTANDISSNTSNNGIISNEEKNILSVNSDLSLGGVELGYSIEQMHKVLGKETSIDEKDSYKFYNYSDIQVGIKNGKVDALVSNSSAVATKRGIHQGSSLKDVFDKYGDNYNKMDYDDLILYEYTFATDNNKNGILRFAISKSNNQVNYISVRIPEEDLNTKSITTTDNSTSNVTNANEAAQALNNYYAAINKHDMRAAYNILSDDMQTHMGSLNDYADGYKTTLSDSISNVQVTSNSGDEIALSYTLTARDSYNSNSIKEQTFACIALLSKKTGSWHIVDMSAKKQGERIMSR